MTSETNLDISSLFFASQSGGKEKSHKPLDGGGALLTYSALLSVELSFQPLFLKRGDHLWFVKKQPSSRLALIREKPDSTPHLEILNFVCFAVPVNLSLSLSFGATGQEARTL